MSSTAPESAPLQGIREGEWPEVLPGTRSAPRPSGRAKRRARQKRSGRLPTRLDNGAVWFAPELNLARNPLRTPADSFYFAFYGLHIEGIRHNFGTFPSNSYVIAAHVFWPEKPRGTAFLLHGYDDHAGVLRNLIHSCVGRNLTVAVFDLPGHGLSSGERAAIDDFGTYADILGDFIGLCKPHVPRPFYTISHSTGCSVVLEYLYSRKPDPAIVKAVFLAPLIRPAHWGLARAAYRVTCRMFDSIPRALPRIFSRAKTAALPDNDPLHSQSLPLCWVKALIDWNRRIGNYGMLAQDLVVIQGTNDTVVDWKYNVEFLRRNVSKCSVHLIGEAGHQLINEDPQTREAVLKLICEYLCAGPS